jgi:hypothetical protein
MNQTLLPRDQHILYALCNYYFFTSKQVQRLYFANRMMKELRNGSATSGS